MHSICTLTMKYLLYHQLFSDFLASLFLGLLTWTFMFYFDISLYDFYMLFSKPSILLTKVEDKLPSVGKCTLYFVGKAGRRNLRTFICTVNQHMLYQVSSYLIGIYCIFGCLNIILHYITLFSRLTIPLLRR